ncbi:MAG TPA: ABC transporter ATP-binding protein, partial [Candidatus Limnocylindrales bacterium]|nr:ABC transporter ATP-binding protein [Candidatus Limnocylindrales bacterium]
MGESTGARITALGWGFRYPGRSAVALSDVSFTIEPGELVVLMGASGSGKSTLLSALAGTLPDGGDSGTLVVAGPGPGRSSARIGLVQQEPEGTVVMERVGDDVAFPLDNAAVPAGRIWPRVVGALVQVGLDVPLDRDTSRLSGGQQQLLAIAAGSVADPHLLLLDEPTANLDPTSAAEVLAAVAAVRAAHGCTVVVVEHRVEAWLARADRVLLVEDGTVLPLDPAGLAAHLEAHPDSAARVWVDHAHLPSRIPPAPRGEVVLVARGVAVADRLPATHLEVHAGEVVAVTGPPGVGKSTLLACLAGLREPTSGTVRVGPASGGVGRVDPWRWPAVEIARTFGVVFQNPEHQFVTGRVVDEVHHGLVSAGVGEPDAAQRAARMLERLHLSDLAAADPFTLSGGEQRRLSVGTALALDPGILLLDEPTFGQDPATWAELVGIIADHR